MWVECPECEMFQPLLSPQTLQCKLRLKGGGAAIVKLQLVQLSEC